MSKEDIWNLFKLTGNTDYYLKYKKIIKEIKKLKNKYKNIDGRKTYNPSL